MFQFSYIILCFLLLTILSLYLLWKKWGALLSLLYIVYYKVIIPEPFEKLSTRPVILGGDGPDLGGGGIVGYWLVTKLNLFLS